MGTSACSAHRPGFKLVADTLNLLGGRPDKDQFVLFAGSSEFLAFGKEAITWMDGLGSTPRAASISVPIRR